MKKITKVVCSTALIVGMLGTAQAFSVSAMVRPIITGDVDENFKVDINDVTLLQNGLAGNAELSPRQFYAGDVNFNGETMSVMLLLFRNILPVHMNLREIVLLRNTLSVIFAPIMIPERQWQALL